MMETAAERTDQEWIHQIKQEDQDAMTELWTKLFTWGHQITKRYQQDEELGRNAAVAAFWRIRERGVYQYSFRGPFLGFCRRILVNEANRRMKPTPHLDEIEKAHNIGEFDPESKVDQATVQARLKPCLEELKAREQEILTLLYIHEKTPQDAADELGIARNNTNVIAYRARQKLHNCLKKQGYQSSADLLSL